jgi:hypothetical protein
MKHYLFLFSLLILAAISGCKKDKKCNPPKMYNIEQEMKDWLYFKTGGYWIYIDSVSGAYDSVYVTKTYYDTLNILHSEVFSNSKSKCTIQSHQEIVIEYETSRGLKYNVAGSYGFGSGVNNNPNPVNGTSSINNLKHSGGDGGYSHFMYFPVLQGTMGYAFGPIIHDTIYNSYEVLGNLYSNVLRVSDRNNGAFNAITKFYHVKHIGVVRKEIYEWKPRHDNSEPKLLHVWELADYKVSQ